MNLKWVAVAITAFAVVGVDARLGSASVAADLPAQAPVYAKAQPTPAAQDWTGFYLGAPRSVRPTIPVLRPHASPTAWHRTGDGTPD